jgi:hypothetical protein
MLAKTFIFGLLASIPIAAALEVGTVGDALDIEKRSYTVCSTTTSSSFRS